MRRNVFFISIRKILLKRKKMLKQSFIRNNYIRLKIFVRTLYHIVNVIFLVFKLLEKKTFKIFLFQKRGFGKYCTI